MGTEKRVERLDKYGRLLGKWGALGAFIAAATPIPDDPVVIPLGLVKYSVTKFFFGYFAGKLLICIVGAESGIYMKPMFDAVFGDLPDCSFSRPVDFSDISLTQI